MKPNDKALDEALSVTQIPEENMREYMRRVLTAAYAALEGVKEKKNG